jgi:hypothetical protein
MKVFHCPAMLRDWLSTVSDSTVLVIARPLVSCHIQHYSAGLITASRPWSACTDVQPPRLR